MLLVSVTSAFAAGKVVGGKMSEHPHWFKESFLDIAEDVVEAAESNKHVILFMHLNGCPYCYKMVEENFKHAPYADFIKEHFDVIAINIRGDREVAFNPSTSIQEKQLARKLKVFYTPTIIFLDQNNQQVARTNGYRSVAEFKLVLDYVKEKAYQHTKLATYIDQHKPKDVYQFRNHPQIIKADNLQILTAKPLAVLFEDKSCQACNKLHDGYLADPKIREILQNFNLVRLDALSDKTITDPAGNRTTAQNWANKLNLTYRPGIVLFDQGKEIARIESELYQYHFSELLRFVGLRHYRDYPPGGYYTYLAERTKEITNSGKDIDLSK
jgi:thioredoxin-related protein